MTGYVQDSPEGRATINSWPECIGRLITAVRTRRRLSIEEARASSMPLNPKWPGAFTRSNNRRRCQFHILLVLIKRRELAVLPMVVSLFINATAQITFMIDHLTAIPIAIESINHPVLPYHETPMFIAAEASPMKIYFAFFPDFPSLGITGTARGTELGTVFCSS